MSRFRAWGIAVVAAASVTTATSAAEPTTTTDSRPLYKRLFSAPKPVGPTVRSGPVTGARPSTMSTPLAPEVVAEAVKAERLAWERRMDVCLKLRQAALDTNDEALMRQIDELERQATANYQTRVAALGVPKVKAPLPPSSNTGFAASLELSPEKTIDPKEAAAKLVAPAAPVPVSGTAEIIRTVSPEGQK